MIIGERVERVCPFERLEWSEHSKNRKKLFLENNF